MTIAVWQRLATVLMPCNSSDDIAMLQQQLGYATHFMCNILNVCKQ